LAIEKIPSPGLNRRFKTNLQLLRPGTLLFTPINMGDSISPFRRRGDAKTFNTEQNNQRSRDSLIAPVSGDGLFTKPLVMKEIQIHIPVITTVP
jgi:hypothetical protein